MVNKVNKLPLKDVLAAIDMNAKNVWDELSDDERKQVSFYLLNNLITTIRIKIQLFFSFASICCTVRTELNQYFLT